MMAPSQATTASPSGELDLMVLALWPKKCPLRAHTARLMAVVFLCTLCVVLGKSNLTFTAKQGDLYGETCAGFCSSFPQHFLGILGDAKCAGRYSSEENPILEKQMRYSTCLLLR